MDAFLAIASRRDERRYHPDPLPAAVATRILDAGRLAGSNRNAQPWTFVLPETRERVERIADAVLVPENVLSAGLAVAIVVPGRMPTAFDAGRAAQNMLVTAWSLGIASCPNAIADDRRACEAVEAGADERVAIVLSFGLPEKSRDVGARSPEEWSARANRKPLLELVRRLA